MVLDSRIDTLDRLGNRYRSHRIGLIRTPAQFLANSSFIARCRRVVTSFMPFLRLRSDVTDVVYTTWLLETKSVAELVPSGLSLWERNGLTPFTILTYRHGNFGPSFLGPFRRIFRSPFQSNWRLYLESPPENTPQDASTVLFLKNSMSSHLYMLGTRLLSDVLATHLPARFSHQKEKDRYITIIESRGGSSPNLNSVTQSIDEKILDTGFSEMFCSWESAVEFLVIQDAAISYTDCPSVLAFSEIELPIDLSTVKPLKLIEEESKCPFIERFNQYGGTLSFVIPELDFNAISECLLKPNHEEFIRESSQ